MRIIENNLQTKLDAGVTTLARAWIVLPRAGEAFGFTEHDEDLLVDGVLCRAGASFRSGDLDASLGLQIDNGGWSGALSAEGISEDMLAKGALDGARISALLVDWVAPESVVHLWSGILGEVRRGAQHFEAELKSPGACLAKPLGRIYTRSCDADLGDARCGVDLAAPSLSGVGSVTNVLAPRRLKASGLSAFVGGLFSRGALIWTSGANSGVASEIVNHTTADGLAIVELLELTLHPIAEGDAFTIKAGCDKTFQTCRARFSNQRNFRGAPHIPGDDALQAAPADGINHDGGAR